MGRETAAVTFFAVINLVVKGNIKNPPASFDQF